MGRYNDGTSLDSHSQTPDPVARDSEWEGTLESPVGTPDNVLERARDIILENVESDSVIHAAELMFKHWRLERNLRRRLEGSLRKAIYATYVARRAAGCERVIDMDFEQSVFPSGQ